MLEMAASRHVIDQGNIVQTLSKNQPNMNGFIHVCSHPFARSLARSLVRSFVCSFIRPVLYRFPGCELQCLDAMRETGKLTSCYSMIIHEFAVPYKDSVCPLVHTACAQVVMCVSQ